MAVLTRIDGKEWLQIYQSLPIPGKLAQPHIDDNLFASLQWMGKDSVTRTLRTHWALTVDNHEVSFLQSYFLSEKVLRLRGLCTKSEYQGKGHMKTLIGLVLKEYQGKAEEVVCFAGDPGLSVCEAVGFQLDLEFQARFVEYLSSSKHEWKQDDTSKIYLLRKKLLS